MKKFFFLFLILLGFGFAFEAQATSTVDGTVIDAESKKPLADVMVVAVNPITKIEHTAITDAKGEFKIAALAPGTYHIKFKKEDYISTDKNKLQVQAKQTHHLNIELSPMEEEDDHNSWRNKGRYGMINLW